MFFVNQSKTKLDKEIDRISSITDCKNAQRVNILDPIMPIFYHIGSKLCYPIQRGKNGH